MHLPFFFIRYFRELSFLVLFFFTTLPSLVLCQTDSPCGAPALTVGTSCTYTNGTTVGATWSTDAANFGTPSCSSPGGGDVWYTFVAPVGGTVTISTEAQGISDGVMALYSAGSCAGPGTQLDCQDDVVGLMPQISIATLTAGVTYYIRFWQYLSGTGTFGICITKPDPPANDDCSGAITVSAYTTASCGGTTAGTVAQATASGDPIGVCGGSADDDVWFNFVATSTIHSVNLSNVAGSTTDLYHSVYSGSCGSLGTALVCSDPNSSSVAGLTIGNTYSVRVYTVTATTGQTTTFDLCIATPPVNDNCSEATAAAVNNDGFCTSQTAGTIEGATASGNSLGACGGTADDDVWYTFVATNTTHYLDLNNITGSTTDLYHVVYNGTCGALGTEILCSDPNSSILTGLTVGNTYYIRIFSWTSSPGQTTAFDLCITSPPPNDECAGAINVAVNSGNSCAIQTSGTILNATASAETIGACGGTANDDVWYSFVANSTDMTININNMSGSTWDLYHTVYSGSCGALGTELNCSDPESSSLTGLTVGNTYYLRIYSYTSSSGQTTMFDICIFPTPPPPANITCNNMEPICSDSPTNFTAQSTGSSAEVGNNYDCLLSQPNPTWFYLEIENPGLLSVDISAGADIDFAIWGPYTNLSNAKAACSTYPLPKDCSFSASNTEQLNVSGTLTGEVYVLLVTNFASMVQVININQSSSAVATTNCGIVALPVGLTSFAIAMDHNLARLNWSTASEVNNDFFEIQRSSEGTLWETIGLRKGAGNSTAPQLYELEDKKPLRGLSYYRLKQVDFDGTVNFSPPRSLVNSPELDFRVYPLPAKEIARINTNNKLVDRIEVVDILGTPMLVDQAMENGEYVLSIAHLQSGVYSVGIYTGEQKTVRRLIKN
jgi:hypothetical protein